MLTLPVEQWIGNAAAVLRGTWGAVTRRSEQSGYSRTAIYTHATRVVHAVVNDQAGELSYEELWAENERLRADNHKLWQAWAEAEELSESKQRELASAGSAMGLSWKASLEWMASRSSRVASKAANWRVKPSWSR